MLNVVITIKRERREKGRKRKQKAVCGCTGIDVFAILPRSILEQS